MESADGFSLVKLLSFDGNLNNDESSEDKENCKKPNRSPSINVLKVFPSIVRTSGNNRSHRYCIICDNQIFLVTGDGSSVKVQLGLEASNAKVKVGAWNSNGSCLVLGDSSGTLYFINRQGVLLFSQKVLRSDIKKICFVEQQHSRQESEDIFILSATGKLLWCSNLHLNMLNNHEPKSTILQKMRSLMSVEAIDLADSFSQVDDLFVTSLSDGIIHIYVGGSGNICVGVWEGTIANRQICRVDSKRSSGNVDGVQKLVLFEKLILVHYKDNSLEMWDINTFLLMKRWEKKVSGFAPIKTGKTRIAILYSESKELVIEDLEKQAHVLFSYKGVTENSILLQTPESYCKGKFLVFGIHPKNKLFYGFQCEEKTNYYIKQLIEQEHNDISAQVSNESDVERINLMHKAGNELMLLNKKLSQEITSDEHCDLSSALSFMLDRFMLNFIDESLLLDHLENRIKPCAEKINVPLCEVLYQYVLRNKKSECATQVCKLIKNKGVREKAVLCLMRNTETYTKELENLVLDALETSAEIKEQKRLMDILRVVKKYTTARFRFDDHRDAKCLIRHILARAVANDDLKLLEDALTLAKSYHKIDETQVYILYLENLTLMDFDTLDDKEKEKAIADRVDKLMQMPQLSREGKIKTCLSIIDFCQNMNKHYHAHLMALYLGNISGNDHDWVENFGREMFALHKLRVEFGIHATLDQLRFRKKEIVDQYLEKNASTVQHSKFIQLIGLTNDELVYEMYINAKTPPTLPQLESIADPKIKQKIAIQISAKNTSLARKLLTDCATYCAKEDLAHTIGLLGTSAIAVETLKVYRGPLLEKFLLYNSYDIITHLTDEQALRLMAYKQAEIYPIVLNLANKSDSAELLFAYLTPLTREDREVVLRNQLAKAEAENDYRKMRQVSLIGLSFGLRCLFDENFAYGLVDEMFDCEELPTIIQFAETFSLNRNRVIANYVYYLLDSSREVDYSSRIWTLLPHMRTDDIRYVLENALQELELVHPKKQDFERILFVCNLLLETCKAPDRKKELRRKIVFCTVQLNKDKTQ